MAGKFERFTCVDRSLTTSRRPKRPRLFHLDVHLTHDVVEQLAVAEGAMATVMPDNEQCPEHRALGKPVEGPHQGVVDGNSTSSDAHNRDDVSC